VKKVLLAAAMLVFVISESRADMDDFKNNVTPFVRYDYLFVGDAYKTTKESYMRSSLSSGDRVTKNNVLPGLGAVRVGAAYEKPDSDFLYGASVGYVKGPELELDFYDDFGLKFSARESVRFTRILMEGNRKFSLGKASSLNLGVGAGLGAGRLSGKLDSYDSEVSESWTGLTWEVSPGFTWTGEKYSFSIGAVFMQFPKKEIIVRYNEFGLPYAYFPEFSWRSYGLTAAFSFKPSAREDQWGF
jgi:hypothetical protein